METVMQCSAYYPYRDGEGEQGGESERDRDIKGVFEGEDKVEQGR